jgi:predicted GIY-YIG superfamily endonuclease
MPHLVYILEMLTGHLYIGSTSNLKRRLMDHAKGFGDRTTRLGGYKRLICAESFPDRLSALRREIQLKGWSRAKKLALVCGNIGTLRALAKHKDKDV